MKKLITIFILVLSIEAFSQAPSIQWQKCMGGTEADAAYSIKETSDGGFIVLGTTYSNNGDVNGNHGFNDYWVVKLDSSGSIQWQKCLGGSADDYANNIQQTNDGGYIVAGSTNSNNGDVNGNHGQGDCWVVKLDTNGNIEWQKCLGGTYLEEALSVLQTSDNGYILAGGTSSNDGDVSGNNSLWNNDDFWIVKLDTIGNILWQKCLGGTSYDLAYSIQQTHDNGFIVTGYVISNDGDVTGNHDTLGSFTDYWVVKLDSIGNIQWQKCLGGTGADQATSIQQTIDGGYIVAGTAYSNNGDVSGNHGNYDSWVIKLNAIGNIQWQKCLGGTDTDNATFIQQTTDGGYILAGYTHSNNGDVIGNHGLFDYWIVKLDTIGNIQWQKCLGGTADEMANSIQQTRDGGYIIAGSALSNNGNVSGLHNPGNFNSDFWIVKLAPSTTININELSSEIEFSIFPNPATVELIIKNEKSIINEVSMYNIFGGLVINRQLNEKETRLDLSKEAKGIYYVKIKDSTQNAIFKKIVIH